MSILIFFQNGIFASASLLTFNFASIFIIFSSSGRRQLIVEFFQSGTLQYQFYVHSIGHHFVHFHVLVCAASRLLSCFEIGVWFLCQYKFAFDLCVRICWFCPHECFCFCFCLFHFFRLAAAESRFPPFFACVGSGRFHVFSLCLFDLRPPLGGDNTTSPSQAALVKNVTEILFWQCNFGEP